MLFLYNELDEMVHEPNYLFVNTFKETLLKKHFLLVVILKTVCFWGNHDVCSRFFDE